MIIPNVFHHSPAEPEKEPMSKSETKQAESKPETLAEALFFVQQELDGIVKDSTNPHFRKSYADRTTILAAIRPLYAKYGLLLVQSPVPAPFSIPSSFSTSYDAEGEIAQESGVPAYLALETVITHVATGEQLKSTAVVPLPKADPQGYGSAITYLSRYSLVAIHALPLIDDDGEGASGRPTPTAKPNAGMSKPAKATIAKKQTKESSDTVTTETKTTEQSTESSTQQTTTTSTAATPEQSTGKDTKAATETSGSKPGAKPGRKLWGK